MNQSTNDVTKMLQAIISTAIDGIITIDANGLVESINIAACILFGYNESEVIGRNINMLMPEPDRSNHDQYIERYHRTRIPHIVGIGREVYGQRKNGEIFPLRLAVSHVELENRSIFTGIIHDLSEVNAARRALESSNSRLEQEVEKRTLELEATVNKLLSTNRALKESKAKLKIALENERELHELKSRFVSMASHEFRTPLSTILSSASLISRYTTVEQHDKRMKHVDRIKSAVDNLTGILNDFLSLSKLDEGRIEVKNELIDVLHLCQAASDDLEGLLKSGQQIVIQHSGEMYRIVTDRRVLLNVLFNVLSNAIKYSPEGSEVRCSVTFLPQEITIDVIDQGIGIPKEDQKHMFSRFFRANNVENIQGTGLGLHIVRQYLTLVGGKISFVSNPGVGSQFTISLPNKADLS